MKEIYITFLYYITNIGSWLDLQSICWKLIYWRKSEISPELVATNGLQI